MLGPGILAHTRSRFHDPCCRTLPSWLLTRWQVQTGVFRHQGSPASPAPWCRWHKLAKSCTGSRVDGARGGIRSSCEIGCKYPLLR